ncbi:MAG: hypothetical protein RL154_1326 [Pseudomonadota bacterium]|jgi:hypothetical protein
MNYINTNYGSTTQFLKDNTKQSTNTAQTSGVSFLDMLKNKSPTEGWPTEKKETPDKIFENQTSAIKDAYRNNSVSAMLESAKSVYEDLKTQVASQNIQIKPTPTLTSILSKM